MKKNSQIRSKILAVLLTVAILFSTALVSSAVEESDYWIKLIPAKNGFTNTDVVDRFQAYQIFQGVINPKSPPDNYFDQLANIEWGANIKSEEENNADTLIAALRASEIDIGDGVKAGEIFSGLPDQATAKDVADILARYEDDSPLVEAFAEIVAGCVIGEPAGISWFDKAAGCFVIDGLGPGYYLIKDTFPEGFDTSLDPQEVYQPYILDVLNNKTVDLKADAPDVDKKIVTPEGGELNGDDYNIGDTITFRLTGTLPENYDMFDTYYYKFTDTLSEGLDYIGNVKAYVVNGVQSANKAEIDNVNDKYYKVVEPNPPTGNDKKILTITFDNLKNLTSPDYTVIHTTKIVVEYEAKLNSNAVINQPNPNTVDLEFSNDPYQEGTGKTKEVRVYVYTFGIDVTKVGSDERQPLPGAQFKIYRKNDDGSIKDYAMVENGKITGWDPDINKGSPIETGADGRFTVDGLDEGTYYLTETKTPDGYDTMEDIEFKIAATIDKDSGELTSSVLTPSEGRKYPGDVTASGGVNSDGRFDLELVNQLASILPGTGGIGNIVFYVGGALIIAVAVILFIVTRRKKSAQKQ